jgi:hypothetical protein
MASASRWALLLALALAPACGDEAPTGNPAPADAGSDARPADAGPDTAADVAASNAPPECFPGTPKTHEELLNACWPETVTAISKKTTLPGGYTVGAALPPLPQ